MKLVAIYDGQRHVGKPTELTAEQITTTLNSILDEIAPVVIPLIGDRTLFLPAEAASMATFLIEPNEHI
jgi:hypothetical protein